MTVYVVGISAGDFDAPFIRAHVDRLPTRTIAIHDQVVLPGAMLPRLARKVSRIAQGQPWSEELTRSYVAAFTERPAAVLAEFGPAGVRVMEACRRARLPLIAHFHGYDISVRAVLDEYHDGYLRLFESAAAIVAVSQDMCRTLIALGAPPEKVHYCPYGVDCDTFAAADPAAAAPLAIAVGRFVDKKAPHLTILAFAAAHRQQPEARLHMIGDGPLLGSCQDLVRALRLEEAVSFSGRMMPHHEIAGAMRKARCFVQHSVRAANGDSEGTPNALLEAGASGLPCVATRHAGIPDVVRHEVTGLLVDERDVDGMAAAMRRLLAEPPLAARMGAAAREHIKGEFSFDRRIADLWRIIQESAEPSAKSSALIGRTPAVAYNRGS
jgi:colanic acid/amylovoran biosynthesis glycosyltransferase